MAANRRSVVLDLVDGGLGDADGIANGIIVDPSGPTVTVGANRGKGGCFIDSIQSSTTGSILCMAVMLALAITLAVIDHRRCSDRLPGRH